MKPRVRPFHPLHRQTPVEGSRLQNLRTVVVWCHGEKQVIQDDWRDGTSPVMPPMSHGLATPFPRDHSGGDRGDSRNFDIGEFFDAPTCEFDHFLDGQRFVWSAANAEAR